MVELTYIVGEKDGKYITATESEIINNALEQERDGIKPHFAWYDYKNNRYKNLTNNTNT